jgi:tetratricopeptide (TPR) repeat protein
MKRHEAESIVHQAAAAFNAGRPNDARRFCEQGLRHWPDEPMLNHLLAAVYFAQGHTRQARDHVEASLRAAPHHGPARLLAARVARAEQDFSAALAHLNHFGATTSSNVNVTLERARTLDQTDRRSEAETAWRTVLQALPQSSEALARLGRLAWEDGHLTEAAALLERAVAGDCPASTWFDLGVVRHDLRDNAGAATAYRQALEKKPDYAEAAVNLGVALQETGDLDGALLAYGTAYRLRPSTFGTIAMALTSSPHGRLWLDEDSLRRSLRRSLGGSLGG